MTVEGLMRKPEHSGEPSIEEILASIRSIIAEDGAPPRSGMKPVNDGAPRRPPRPQNLQNPDNAAASSKQDHSVLQRGPRTLNTADSNDEILELTEDFMLAEPAASQSAASAKSRTANLPVRDFYSEDASGDFRPAPSREEEELDEVLSNLAAEVERLAAPDAVQKRSSEADAERSTAGEWDDSQDQPDSGGISSFGAPEFAEPDERSAGQPQIAGIAEPRAATASAPAGLSPAAQPPQFANVSGANKSKPVWSARRLEQRPAASSRMEPAAVEEQPAPPEPPQEPPAAVATTLPSTVSRRDLWAEGVQMPVPDTGPEMPLPLTDPESRKTTMETGASPTNKSAVEDDRRAVGSFLTRVFGSAPPEHADDTAAGEKSLRGKAEKLARDTISGFAEEKLNAPAVGNALKADKDFMNEVASSLESALASSEDSDAPDLPESASGSGADLETYVQPVQDSGLDMKLKEALAADARTSETIAAEQKLQEDALSAETAALVVQSIARDERPGPGPADTAQRTPQADEAAPIPAEAAAPPRTEASKADLPAPVLNLPGSLEGSIKEMIKPLIIQWLNENLPRIVEEAVREELTGRSGTGGQRDRSTG
jgi:hypothetical protein